MSLHLSASTWNYLCAYGDDADLPTAIGEIADAGLGIELWVNWWIGLEAVAPDQWPEINKMLDGGQVSLHSALGSWDADAFRMEIKLAKYVGAPVMVIHGGGLGFDEDEGKLDMTPCIFAAEYASSQGVKLALENTPFPNNIETVHAAIEAAPHLGICIDIAHAYLVKQDPAELIRTLGTKVVHMHASDLTGDEDEHLAPGDGDIPRGTWKEMFQALAELDYSGEVVMEIRSDEPRVYAQKSAQFLRAVADEAGFVSS